MTPSVYELLSDFGMKEIEQKIYLSILKLGEMSIAQISKQINKARSSSYDMVTAMAKEGRLSTHTRRQYNSYSATSPQNLIDIMKKRMIKQEEKTAYLSNHLSIFDEYTAESLSPTTLRLFEGGDAMETIFLDTTFDEGYFIWDIDMIIDFAGRDIDKVVEKFGYNHIKKQYSLLRESTASIQYLRMVQEKGITNNHIKLLPPEYDLSGGEISLIDGVVSFLIFKNPVKAIVIDNDVVYKNQRLMFETLRQYTPEYTITYSD